MRSEMMATVKLSDTPSPHTVTALCAVFRTGLRAAVLATRGLSGLACPAGLPLRARLPAPGTGLSSLPLGFACFDSTVT